MTEELGFSDHGKVAAKIQAILALAESEAKAGNEGARDTLLEKAAALQLKYAIADAMLAVGDKDKDNMAQADFCVESNTPLIKAKRQLINSIAQLNRGHAVMMGAYERDAQGDIVYRTFRGKYGPVYNRRALVRVYAHKSDLEFITMLYNSLIIQMQTMMANDERNRFAYEERVGSSTRKVVSAWRVSYAYGWVARVHERMQEAKRRNERQEETSTPGTALVLRDRDAVVQAHVAQLHPNLKSANYRVDDKSADGRMAGRQAAERADLGGKRVSSSDTRAIEG